MKRMRLAAVQSGVDPEWTPSEWTNHLRWQLSACREAEAEMVVFPAWTGAYMESFPHGYPRDALGTLLGLLGELAREARTYLVPGSIPVRCVDGLRIRSFLLSPSGALLGAQDQLCPPSGYASGGRLSVFPTPVGRIGLVIAEDAQVPEIGRILALQGAELFCAPSAHPVPYNPWRQEAGLWQVVQANQVAAVEACLVGEFNGRNHQGRSRILGTVEMTADGDGLLAQAKTLEDTEIVLAELEPEALARSRTAFPIFAGFNVKLYQGSLADAYRRLGESTVPTAEPHPDIPGEREPEGGLEA